MPAGERGAIDWVRTHLAPDALVLQAAGHSYAADESRLSVGTGRTTLLGWDGHELQWRHDPGRREADVRTLYTTTDERLARGLLARYGVDYVVAGPIERADYGEGGLAKWDELGRRVLDRDGTTVWALG